MKQPALDTTASSPDLDRSTFAAARTPWRDVTLWFLNDDLEPGALRAGVRDLHAAGFGTVIARSFNGLSTPYLSEPFFAAHAALLEEAADVGLDVWLQAGHMPSMVPDLPAEYCMQGVLELDRDAERQPDDELLFEHEGRPVVRRRHAHQLHLLDPQACRHYLRVAYEDTWLARFAEHFGRTVSAIWVDEPSLQNTALPWSAGVEAKLLDRTGLDRREAVTRLLHWSDDAASVRHHYRRAVLDALLEGYFRPIQRWSEAHDVRFAGHLMGEDTLRTQTLLAGGCMPCYPLMGVIGIDHLTAGLHWWHGSHDEADGGPMLFRMTPLQAAGAAHQLGRGRVLAEMYGVSTQHMTPALQRRIGEFLFAQGVNLRCLHGTPYSLRGRRKRIYPPALSRHQPWWAEQRRISDHFARLTTALTAGEHEVDALLLHPLESAWMYARPAVSRKDPGAGPDVDRLAAHDRAFGDLLAALAAAAVSIDLGDEALLAEQGDATDDRFLVGGRRYRVVLVPPVETIRRSTLELLRRFAAGGGTILRTDDALPTRLDGEPSDEPADLLRSAPIIGHDATSLAAWFDRHSTDHARIRSTGGSLPLMTQRRRTNDGWVVFLANPDPDASVEAKVTFPTSVGIELLAPTTGRAAAIEAERTPDRTTCTLDIPPGSSRLLQAMPRSSMPPAPRKQKTSITLAGPWSITRHGPNALVLDFCRVRRGDEDWSEPLPLAAVEQWLTEDEPYTGPLTLRFTFDARTSPPRAAVVVDSLDDWSVSLNGHDLDAAARERPWIDRHWTPLDITRLIRESNVLDLACDYHPLKPAPGLADRFATLPGIELDNAYIIGDFAVDADPGEGPAAPGVVRQRQPRLAAEPETTDGSLTTAGYPFLPHRATLTQTADLPPLPPGARAQLRLEPFHAASARVFVNDAEAGAILWEPFAADITPHVRPGPNAFRIELAPTLRNLLGPLHRPPGLREQTWGPIAFSGRYDWDTRQGFPGWYRRPRRESSAWSDDYFLVRFGIESARIEIA